jgi:predicted nucleic acid-binding protein
VLVDTSVWIDHLRRGSAALGRQLSEREVWCHPFVIGELACGQLEARSEVLSLLSALPQAPLAGHDEVLAFVAANRLAGRGIGWIDVHLLAAARLASVGLWTLDRPLAAVAVELGSYVEPE